MKDQEPTTLTERDLAKRWVLEETTLQKWRQNGRGPKFFKLHRTVRYRLEDVIAFENGESK